MAKSALIGALRVSLGLDTAQFDTGLDGARASLSNFGKAAGAALAGFAAAFAYGVGAAVSRVDKMEAASRRLDKALANSGNAAKTSAAEVEEWASKLERRTGRAVDEVMAVGANLASFNFGEEVFFRSIALADDMAAAWGGDLKGNLEGLARALDDPVNGFAMLRKRGIALTDSQAAMVAQLIKANDKLGAQKVVLQALEDQVKGVAEAGYQGLARSFGNLTVAVEGFFDRIATTASIGTLIAMAIDPITTAVDYLTEHLAEIAPAAAIAGTALAVAFAPAVIAAGVNAILGGLALIRAAILANPFVAFVSAIAAAVTAAYYFRDEIRQAIGVDVIGIMKDAANKVIGSFVAAYEDIRFVWANFPEIVGAAAIGAVNAVIRAVNQQLRVVREGVDQIRMAVSVIPGLNVAAWTLGSVQDIPEVANASADQLAAPLDARNQAVEDALNRDYIGEFGRAVEAAFNKPEQNKVATELQGVESAAVQSAEAIKRNEENAKRAHDSWEALRLAGQRVFQETLTPAERLQYRLAELNRLLQAGAIDWQTYDRAVAKAQADFDKTGNEIKKGWADIGRAMSQPIQGAIEGLIQGTYTWRNALVDALKILTTLITQWANSGFSMNSGIGAVIGSIFSSIPGFASGGSFTVGGTGGIDSQLVSMRLTPGELVEVTKPGQRSNQGFVFAPNTTIDARGSSLSRAELEAILNQRDRRNRDEIAGIVNEFRQRGRL